MQISDQNFYGCLCLRHTDSSKDIEHRCKQQCLLCIEIFSSSIYIVFCISENKKFFYCNLESRKNNQIFCILAYVIKKNNYSFPLLSFLEMISKIVFLPSSHSLDTILYVYVKFCWLFNRNLSKILFNVKEKE